MPGSIRVDTRGFSGMCKDLVSLANKSGGKVTYPQVVKAETAKVLERAIQYTKRSDPKKLKEKAAKKVLAKFNTYASGAAGTKDTTLAGVHFTGSAGKEPRISISQKKGTVWVREGGKFHIMAGTPRRWSDKRWNAYQQQEAERRAAMEQSAATIVPRVMASAGMSKQAWFQAAVELGLDGMMKVPAYVKKAKASNQRTYQNGEGRDESSAFKTLLVVTNKSPSNANGSAEGALNRAISTRLSAFETELSKGVFNDAKLRAARHPGVFVR